MAKYILMEEFHVTVTAAPDQRQHVYHAIARALREPRLHASLRHAIRNLFRRHSVLGDVRVRLTR